MAQEARITPKSNESRITKLARMFMRQGCLIEAEAQLKMHGDVDVEAQASVEFAMSIRASRALAGLMNFVSQLSRTTSTGQGARLTMLLTVAPLNSCASPV